MWFGHTKQKVTFVDNEFACMVPSNVKIIKSLARRAGREECSHTADMRIRKEGLNTLWLVVGG